MSDTQHGRVWLITGASSGFGRHVAEEVLTRGGAVVATSREPGVLSELAGSSYDRVLVAPLDVTNAAEAEAAVRGAEARFGRVDVLLNNAGYGGFGGIEETPEADIEQQFAVNVFGALRMMRLVLPVFRRQRSGHILNLSSLAGMRAHAGYGFYAASKFALEALSESLAEEAGPLGISITIVEPSGFRTDFNGRSLRVVPATRRIADYAATSGKFQDNAVALDGQQPGDPAKAAIAMVDVTERPEPPLRLPLGAYALTAIREKLDLVRRDIDAGEATAIAADFPGAVPA
jgi:NAD(P)-dependent dehydrogenase (short-subunit alcohol dehydrogenase family)